MTEPLLAASSAIASVASLRGWKPEDGGEKWFCGDCASSLFGRNLNHADPIGYYYISPEAMPELSSQFGTDQSRYPVPAPASGGIVSSPADVAKWARALFTGRELPRKQQRELESLISTQTGEPIKKTTPTDPAGFGLGVQQGRDPILGTVWAYQGSTLGYRFLVIYLPHSGSTIAIGVNSLPEHDNLGQLANSVYATLHKAGLG